MGPYQRTPFRKLQSSVFRYSGFLGVVSNPWVRNWRFLGLIWQLFFTKRKRADPFAKKKKLSWLFGRPIESPLKYLQKKTLHKLFTKKSRTNFEKTRKKTSREPCFWNGNSHGDDPFLLGFAAMPWWRNTSFNLSGVICHPKLNKKWWKRNHNRF